MKKNERKAEKRPKETAEEATAVFSAMIMFGEAAPRNYRHFPRKSAGNA